MLSNKVPTVIVNYTSNVPLFSVFYESLNDTNSFITSKS
jgi:hypothetical protein